MKVVASHDLIGAGARVRHAPSWPREAWRERPRGRARHGDSGQRANGGGREGVETCVDIVVYGSIICDALRIATVIGELAVDRLCLEWGPHATDTTRPLHATPVGLGVSLADVRGSATLSGDAARDERERSDDGPMARVRGGPRCHPKQGLGVGTRRARRGRLCRTPGGPMSRRMLIAVVLVGGCGKAGTLVLDEEVVAERIARIDASVPNCHAAPSAGALAMTSRKLGEVVEAMRLLAQDAPRYAGVGTSGACGGDLGVTFSHESGITDYVGEMIDFCVSGPEGQIVYNGTIKAKEVGNPSPNGPVIKSLELSTDGPVTVLANGETIEVTVTDSKTVYGDPQPWVPGTPAEGKPDVTKIGSIKAVFVDHGREDYIEDLVVERTGFNDATVEVKGGRVGTVGEDFVVVSTPADDPVLVNVVSGIISGGTLELTGAKKTVVTVQPRDGVIGVFDVEVNGEPVDQSVDCSSGEMMKAEVIQAILAALPIY